MRLSPALLACTLLAVGCGSGPSPAGELPPADIREARWEAWRAAKDSLFQSPDSPLLPAQQDTFTALAYFPYDSSLAFSLPLEPALDRTVLRLATSTGEPRDYVRFGALSFARGDRRHRLTVFQPTDGSGELFVPFADATNGRGTYAAGRYLDFRPTADGRYVLDFNYAYNPYCVYNPAYSCPLPPPENRLDVAVPAGERAEGKRPDGAWAGP